VAGYVDNGVATGGCTSKRQLGYAQHGTLRLGVVQTFGAIAMDIPGRFLYPNQNRLLSALSPDVRSRLFPWMEKVSLPSRHTLYAADTPLTHVWFPLSGVVSLVLELKNAVGVEIGTVGNEGMIGVPLFLGAERSPIRAFCQVAGQGLRMRGDAFRRALVENPELEDVVRRYAHAMLNQASRSTACNYVHSVRERLCRWLLVTQDRVGSDEFQLTQELLAHTLAVRRPSVTIAAGLLRRDRLIDYQRGRVRVLDRAGLEAASCECYSALRQELDRMFDAGDTGTAAPVAPPVTQPPENWQRSPSTP
jgi:CRP-like cAMP-binding protein